MKTIKKEKEENIMKTTKKAKSEFLKKLVIAAKEETGSGTFVPTPFFVSCLSRALNTTAYWDAKKAKPVVHFWDKDYYDYTERDYSSVDFTKPIKEVVDQLCELFKEDQFARVRLEFDDHYKRSWICKHLAEPLSVMSDAGYVVLSNDHTTIKASKLGGDGSHNVYLIDSETLEKIGFSTFLDLAGIGETIFEVAEPIFLQSYDCDKEEGYVAELEAGEYTILTDGDHKAFIIPLF